MEAWEQQWDVPDQSMCGLFYFGIIYFPYDVCDNIVHPSCIRPMIYLYTVYMLRVVVVVTGVINMNHK